MRLLELASALFRVREITAIQSNEGTATVPLTLARMIRRVICAGFIGLFIWSSVPSVSRAFAGPFPKRIDAFHSSDTYFEKVTGLAHESQRIIDALDSLPPGKPLLVFNRDKDPISSWLGMALAYLAWPREVRFELIEGPRCDQQLAKIAPDSIGAIAFCNVQPPRWLPGGMSLGQYGKLVAVAKPAAK